jgi:hypothetical protein
VKVWLARGWSYLPFVSVPLNLRVRQSTTQVGRPCAEHGVAARVELAARRDIERGELSALCPVLHERDRHRRSVGQLEQVE